MLDKYLEIVGPEYLEPGQNFYKQPPFEVAISQATRTKSPITVSEAAQILTKIASKHHNGIYASGVSVSDTLSTVELCRRMQLLYDLELILNKDPAKNRRDERFLEFKMKDRPAVRALGLALEEFPNWTEYIFMRLIGPQRYKNNGDYINLDSDQEVRTQSYGKWMEAEGRSILLGLEEVFGENLEGLPLSSVIGPRRAESSRWQVLAAIEVGNIKKSSSAK